MKIIKLLEKSTNGASFWDQELINSAAVTEYKSRNKLIDMDIDDFLKLAEPLAREVDSKTKDIESISKTSKFNTLPFLMFSYDNSDETICKVYGHEGRHRALFLKRQGCKTMPVLLKSYNIRWSEQQDPNRFDYKDVWPEYLIGEDGVSKIKFPVSREDSPKDYR